MKNNELTTDFVFGLWLLIIALMAGILAYGSWNIKEKKLLVWFSILFVIFLLAGLKVIGWLPK